MKVVTETNIKEFKLLARGKVRDIYLVTPQTLLIVTTDRISAFDVIMPEPIPYKGVILNKITLFWMDMFADIIPNHLVNDNPGEHLPLLAKYKDELSGRSVLVHKTSPLPVECIVRGYITGSGWKDYKATGKVCGHDLPGDLVESQELPNPIFTPSTKAELGEHDENITLDEAKSLVGQDMFEKARQTSVEIYTRAKQYAQKRGIIIADTKFEFGIKGNELLLIDEVLTPDSSRFWPENEYAAGRSQKSFDKQYLRDWLETLDWDKKAPGPHLPEKIVNQTLAKYLEAFERLTGEKLEL